MYLVHCTYIAIILSGAAIELISYSWNARALPRPPVQVSPGRRRLNRSRAVRRGGLMPAGERAAPSQPPLYQDIFLVVQQPTSEGYYEDMSGPGSEHLYEDLESFYNDPQDTVLNSYYEEPVQVTVL